MRAISSGIALGAVLVVLAPAPAADNPEARTESHPEFAASTRKPADRVQVKLGADAVTLDVSSPSGIGGATIKVSKGQWPKTVVVRLRTRGLEFFTISNGAVKLRASVLSHSGNPRLLSVVEDKKETKVEKDSRYWTEIRSVEKGGQAAAGLPGKEGYFEIQIPQALLTAKPKSLELDWIDFYR